MKKIVALFLVLFITISINAKGFDGKIYYSEATDVFTLMDHVSGFRLNALTAYSESWTKKHKITLEEQNLFDEYIKLRTKYYAQKKFENLDQTKLLFSHIFVPQFDLIADAFYTSQGVGEALKKLQKKLKPTEVVFLQKFYKAFKKKIVVFLKESSLYSQKLKAINKDIKKYKMRGTIKKMVSFLGVPRKLMDFRLVFVWWPSSRGPKVTYGHNVVLLHYNPISHTENMNFRQIAKMVMRAVIHRMPFNQKQNLSKRFFQECLPKGINSENILERPLMVLAGSVYPYKNSTKKKEFNLYQKWDENPWINSYVKLIYPALEQAIGKKENISVHFIQHAAQSCQELVKVAKYLSK